MAKSRKFDGYRYTLHKTTKLKTTAKNIADGLRNKGKFSRVTEESNGYTIWTRSMRGRGWSK